MPLYLPNGDKSDEFIMVLGKDAAQARSAKNDAIRARLTEDASQEDSRLIMIAGFIDSWSFKMDCTQESKIEMLSNAPYISDSIDYFAADNDNFTKK